MASPGYFDSFTAPKEVLAELAEMAEEIAPEPKFAPTAFRQIASRQSDYQNRRFERNAYESADAFEALEKGRAVVGGYQDTMRLHRLVREEERVRRAIERKADMDLDETSSGAGMGVVGAQGGGRKRRWDPLEMEEGVDMKDTKDESFQEVVVGSMPKKRRSRWDEPPSIIAKDVPGSKKTSRWDQPSAGDGSLAPILMIMPGIKHEDEHGRYLTNEELDAQLPTVGYVVVTPPAGYALYSKPRKLPRTPTVLEEGFQIKATSDTTTIAAVAGVMPELPTDIPGIGPLAFVKREDTQYFALVMKTQDETELSVDELKERKILRLLLKIKNGLPPARRAALRQITDKARDFGAGPLFDKILPLLMERTLEDQERHLLVKVIDRVLYKLDDLVRPYVHKILVVIEPLLIDDDYYARVEGRGIISNLAKAAGLAHMISTMRPDIDHADEYVRNTTARAFAVVASALGVPSLLPFLKAVCRSRKSWQARHTGARVVQQIAVLMGCGILPHLRALADCMRHGLEDEQPKVRTMTALALAALSEAAAPYGIESFDTVLKPLWLGVRAHRGKSLAAFLKAAGSILPLMDPEHAGTYVKQLSSVAVREFRTADEGMKRIVLKVLQQCAATDGVTPQQIREDFLPHFFDAFWVRRMALDRRSCRLVVETTVELAQKTGTSEIVTRIVDGLKDGSEPFRKMAAETIMKVVASFGVSNLDEPMEVRLIDGILFAFQEQTMEDPVVLDAFGTIVNAFGIRARPYLTQIASIILWRLSNKSAKVR